MSLIMLAPEREGSEAGYICYLEAGSRIADTSLMELAGEIEQGLTENYHYRHARSIGQLSALRLFRVSGRGREVYLERCIEEGQRPGDVKPALLDKRWGWTTRFEGEFIKQDISSIQARPD